MTFNTILVFFLVVSPVDLPVPESVPAPVLSALKELAHAAELAGPKCSWSSNFRYELVWVREHWRECRSYPTMADCQRLPSYAMCTRNALFVWEHLRYLEHAQSERLHWDVSDRICCAKQLLKFWNLARDATNDLNCWCRRRKALDEMRRMIGQDAYATGAWPALVSG